MHLHQLLRIGAAAAALSLSVPAWAENKSPDKQAEVQSRMKALIGKMLRQEVGLDEKQAREVEKILDQFKPERRRLRGELRTHRQKLRELLQKNSDDQQAYQTALRQFRETQKKLQSLRERELDAVSKTLTPKQQAKFMQSLRRLQRRLNKALERYDGARD
jgi:Spy/CpxP family protein refolding chaperone